MKKILFLILLCICIFFLYRFTLKKENIFFSIGNERGDFSYNKENLKVKSSQIQIDGNAFFSLSSYQGILEQLEDLEELFKILRKYCKEKIEFILLKGTGDKVSYTNKKISILCKKYDIIILR